MMAHSLEDMGIAEGQAILSTHKEFDGYKNKKFVQAVANQGIDYVVNNVRGDSIRKDHLMNLYKIYEGTYNKHTTSFIADTSE